MSTFAPPNVGPSPSSAQPSPARAEGHGAPAVDSKDLLRGRDEILIRHGDEVYRLRHTRNDRLILTK